MDANIADEDRILGQRAIDLVRGCGLIGVALALARTGRDRRFPVASALDPLQPHLPRRVCLRRLARPLAIVGVSNECCTVMLPAAQAMGNWGVTF
jgi:hypothetical protein